LISIELEPLKTEFKLDYI